MTLIVARPRRGRTAHLFNPEWPGAGARRTALCGDTFHAAELAPLPGLGGALPCERCLRSVPDDLFVPTIGFDPAAFPVDVPGSHETYAVGLRGEFVWHRVPERTVTSNYEGREVVVTECGCIGFFLRGIPPERYQPCGECAC